jgi:predicted transcriptional regulator
MASIEKIASPAPILDSNTAIFDAIEYLISKDCIHAFVQHEGKTIGIVAVEQLLENYKSRDMSDVTIREYMGPILKIKAGEEQARAAEIMSEHDVEFIAVTNQNGVFVGVASFDNLGNSSSVL